MLTKSDYKVARTCPAKLYYKKLGYPSTRENNEFLKLLAKGGYIVEEIARQMYPGGIEIDYAGGHTAAAAATAEAMQRDSVTLYEGTFICDNRLVRVDILHKSGDRIELIEVKAKSWDSKTNNERLANDQPRITRHKRDDQKIAAKWIDYIEDVAFQYSVLSGLYPDAEIIPYLMVVDKEGVASIDVLYQYFDVHEEVHPETGRSSLRVAYVGDPDKLRSSNLLTRVNVSEEVDIVLPDVRRYTESFLASLSPEITRIDVPVSTNCASCEYRVDGQRSGFSECWSAHGLPEHHILELAYARDCRSVHSLIDSGKSSLFDLQESDFFDDDGEPRGKRSPRQWIQVRHTESNTEWFSDSLGDVVSGVQYPLHFIDFETSALAIPYYEGMRPYKTVAFQWSCHTSHEPGGVTEHSAWINESDEFPNFEFASTLKDQLGDDGTVFMWGTHERAVLNAILKQMKQRKHGDPELRTWLQNLASPDGRMIDMCKLCEEHYFHPLMRGKTSIKNVCDAVWQESAEVRSLFPEYEVQDDDVPASPYQMLPPFEVGGESVVVAEGTGAMIAYGKMLYGRSASEADRQAWKELLLQYCKLDTAAMVMVWRRWEEVVE